MEMKKNTSLFQKEIIASAFKQAFVKLNPKMMLRNPVMFTVEIGTAIMFGVCLWIISGEQSQGSLIYNCIVFLVLFLTLLFANFAEAIAEARGKAQADSLRKTREETPARKMPGIGKIFSDEVEIIPSSQLKKGDLFYCEAGDIIPIDGEIVVGLATIDESAITGESAPVIREAIGDKSSVTAELKFYLTVFRFVLQRIG